MVSTTAALYFLLCFWVLVQGPLSYLHPDSNEKIHLNLPLDRPIEWTELCNELHKQGIGRISDLLFDDLGEESEFANLPLTLLKHYLTPSHILQLLRGPLGRDLFPSNLNLNEYSDCFRKPIALLWRRLKDIPVSVDSQLRDSLVQSIPLPYYSLLHPLIPLNSPLFGYSINEFMYLFNIYPQDIGGACRRLAERSLEEMKDLKSYCLSIVVIVVILSNLVEQCPQLEATVGRRLSLLTRRT